MSASIAATSIFTAANYTTTIISLEPYALNVEYQHFILRFTETNLNPVPNAHVCVFDSTYYKITTTNYISKTSLYTTFYMYPSGPRPWPLKILMFALLVTREIATYS